MKILRKFYSSVLLVACLATGASALPEGASVTHGNVRITNSGGTQTIVQGSDRAIINWNGFNIDIGELVQFIQPSSLSAILNRVVGQDPSLILGSLQANGQVFLVNPNGVVFGDSARVDVGSLVVSTLNITDDNFLQGNLRFEQAADQDLAAVINHGTIKIDNNGFLVLTGPMVANEGVILARVGQVALAAGTKSTVSFDPTGMIQVELPSGSQSSDGIVSLTQDATSELLSNLVTAPDTKAGQLVVRDGRTFLEVAGGTVVNTGEIRTDGADNQDAGRIVLDSTANTLLAAGSVLSSAGLGANSSGGEIYVLSDGQAVSSKGSLIDVSGGESGDGGFAEQSSLSGRVAATLNLSATQGKAGRFLIDPERIVVQTGDGSGSEAPGPNVVAITEDFIEGVASGTVELVTEDGVDFEALNNGSLALQTDVNLSINLTNPGGDGNDAITFAGQNDIITLAGTGTFTLTSVTGTDVAGLQVETEAGDIFADIGSGSFLYASLISDTGNIDVVGQGSLSLSTSGDASVESTGRTTLYNIQAENFTGSGDSFEIGETVLASNRAEFDITGKVRGYGSIEASEVKIKADSVGGPDPSASPSFRIPLNVRSQSATVEANDIYMDYFPTATQGQPTSIVVTNPTGETEITMGGEISLIYDQPTQGGRQVDIDGYSVDSVTYNTSGDRNIYFYGNTVSFTTDGAITGFTDYGENFSLTGSSIDLDSAGFDGETLNLIATSGDIDLNIETFLARGESGLNVNVNAQAANGSVSITTAADLTVDLEAGTSIDLEAASIFGEFDAPILDVVSTLGDITLVQSGSQDVSVSAVAVDGSDAVDITTTGSLSTRDIRGTDVTLTASGSGSDITTESDRILGSSTVTLNASDAIDVDVQAFTLDLTTGTGSATVDSVGSLVYVLADISQSLTLTHSEGVVEVGEITAGGEVAITVTSGDIRWPGESQDPGTITASTVTLSGGNVSAIVDAPIVSATANNQLGGKVFLTLLSDSTVSGSSTQHIDIFSENDITVGAAGLTAEETIFLSGVDISGSGTVDADLVSISGNSAQLNLGTNVEFASFFTTGDTTLTGSSSSLDLSGNAGGNLNVSNSGSLFTSESNIFAATATLTGSTVSADVSAGEVNATATSGDVDLNLYGENTTVSASSTGKTTIRSASDMPQSLTVGTGNITSDVEVDIDMSGNINAGTGVVDAPSVRVQGASVDLNLGSNTALVSAQSSEGDLSLSGSSTALTVDASSPANVDISNSGSLEIAEAGVSGTGVTLSGTDLSGSGKVTAQTLAATASAGDISLELGIPSNDSTIIEADATGSIYLTVDGPGFNPDHLYGLGVGVGNITAGTLIDIQAPGFTTLVGAGVIDAPSVVLNVGSMNTTLGSNVSDVRASTTYGDLFLDILSPDTTIEASVQAQFSRIMIDSIGNLTVGELGVNGHNQIGLYADGTLSGTGEINAPTVNLSGSSIDVAIGDEVGELYSYSTGDTTLTVDRETAAFSLSGSTGAGASYTFKNNVGSVSSNFLNVSSEHLILEAATWIYSYVASSHVTATSDTSDITLILQGETETTVDAATENGYITLYGEGDTDILVGNQLGLTADSVNIYTEGDVSGSGSINAPHTEIYADTIDVVLGADTESLDAISSGDVTITGNSAVLNAGISVGEGGAITVDNIGDVTVSDYSGSERISGSSGGTFEVTSYYDINVGNITANEILLEIRYGEIWPGNVVSAEGTRLVADTVTASGGSVNINTQAQTINAEAIPYVYGGIVVNNSGSNVTSAQLIAELGEVEFNTDGNASGLDVSALYATLKAGGSLSGVVDTAYTTEIEAGSVNLSSLTSSGLRVNTTSGDATIQATPNTDFFEVRGDVAGNLNLTTSTGDIILYKTSAGGQANLTASNGGIRHNFEAPGAITAASANLTALNDIVVNLGTSSVNAVSTGGQVNLEGLGSGPLTVQGTAAGDFTVRAQGNIDHRSISGANVTLETTQSADITGGNGTSADAITTTGSVTLSGRNITADTHAGSISATASNNATVSNFSNAVDAVNIEAGRDASFTSVGTANIEKLSSTNNLTLDVGQAVTGTFSGNSVTLAGTQLDVTVNANQLRAVARNGNATIKSNSTDLLTVGNSSASGNFNLTHQGAIGFDRIQAQNVTLNAAGDITDTANTIIASGITLNGNNVFVNTQGQVIVINAQGNVTVSNTSVNVDSLTIDTAGNVTFGTDGNLAISQVAGGQLVSLTAGGSVTTTGTNSFVSGNNVKLNAGGSITPDLDNPLNVRATESIEVTAHTVNVLGQGTVLTPDQIAAALSGELPISSLLVGDGSGPIYYNGVLVNGASTPESPGIPPISLDEVTNQLGQQNGQVVDDGSVGSAANDGLVEQSPTQKLVAQLTEAAGGGNGSGGLETSVLITLEIDALGEVQVKLGKPSPYDEAIENSEDMSADSILDLDTEELNDVKVALYYDPATDQLVLAVDLRADDILDLDISNFQEIPIKLEYSFLSDPKILIEKLRADHLIDLEVEDLGQIPIRVHVEGDDRSASE